MMRWAVESSLRFRVLVALIAAAVLGVGIAQLRDTPVDVLPEFSPPHVEVHTEALGLSAPEVEQLITVPLEEGLLNGVAGIDTIRSESVPGLSSVVLTFAPGTDLLDARQLVQERLTRAHILPNVSKPPVMLQPLSSTNRVMMVGLSSRDVSLIDMSVLARWTIRPRLLGVSGVANVAIWGQREFQMQVQVQPERLRARGVSLAQVLRTAGNAQIVSPLSFLEASTPGGGGFIESPNQRLQVQHILPIARPEGLAQVPIEGVEAGGLKLGDVSRIVTDHQPLIGDAVINEGPGLLLVVEKLPGANTLEVSRKVEEALAGLQPGLVGIEVDSTIFRPATFIEKAIDNLTLTAIISAVLLALVLAAFLLAWRAVAVALVSIVLSLVTAALALHLLGESLNSLALAGLALAVVVVVDEVVIGVENTWRRLRQDREAGAERSMEATVLESALEVRGPLVFATLIVLLSVTPILFLAGRPDAFFEPLVLSYLLAVVAAMVVALTVTPALSLLLLQRAPRQRGDSPVGRWLTPHYGALLSRLTRAPGAVFVAAGVIALGGLVAMTGLGQPSLPSFKERQLLVSIEGGPGTSRPEMSRISARISQELNSIKGVSNVGAHVGRAIGADQIVGINSGALWVTIDDGADYDATVRAVREAIDGYPGLRREVMTYSAETIRNIATIDDGSGRSVGDGVIDVLTGADEALVVRIYGTDLAVLRRKADEVRQLLADVDGVVDPQVEAQVDEPAFEIEPDLAAIGRVGIKPGDVRRAAATLVSGVVVGSLFEEQKVFDVIVVGAPGTRHSPSSIRQLPIDTPSGEQVLLGDVADVRVSPSPTVIRRDAASRRIDVSAGVSGRGLGAVRRDVERRLADVAFPQEYHTEVLGEAHDGSAGNRLLILGIAAAIGVFLLLQAAIGSWFLAGLLFLALPLSVVGALIAALIAGGDLSLGALAGFFAVYALAARHSLLLVTHYQRLEREEGEPSGPGLLARGARERLLPTLTSTAAIAIASLPFVVIGSIAGLEILHPMAVVILGGLVTSTLLTLLVVPALYGRFGNQPAPLRRFPTSS